MGRFQIFMEQATYAVILDNAINREIPDSQRREEEENANKESRAQVNAWVEHIRIM